MYDDGELTYSVDDNVSGNDRLFDLIECIVPSQFFQISRRLGCHVMTGLKQFGRWPCDLCEHYARGNDNIRLG